MIKETSGMRVSVSLVIQIVVTVFLIGGAWATLKSGQSDLREDVASLQRADVADERHRAVTEEINSLKERINQIEARLDDGK